MQAELEAALRVVLLPLVRARESHFKALKTKPLEEAGQADEEPGTDNTESETIESDKRQSQLPVHQTKSSSSELVGNPLLNPLKHQIRIAVKKARPANLGGSVATGTHQLNLRSGRNVTVPHNVEPEKYQPRFLLDKSAAWEGRPAICDALVVGINAVTRYLEEEIEDARRELAGLPIIDREVTGRHLQESFRHFDPALKLSTRRQRREIRNDLSSDGRSRPKRRVSEESGQWVMPDYLEGVPKANTALVHVLQEIKDELEMRSQTVDTGIQEQQRSLKRMIESVNAILESLIVIHPVSDLDPQASSTSTSTPAVEKSGTIRIPTGAIEDLLFHSGRLSDASRSILMSLFVRYDSSWFIIRNKIEAQVEERSTNYSYRTGGSRKIAKIDQQPFGFHSTSSSPIATSPIKKAFRNTDAAKKPSLHLVLVAKEDINPVEIVQHLLTAVAARNSIEIALNRQAVGKVTDTGEGEKASTTAEKKPQGIYLVPLGKGAEARMAELLGIRRAAVIAFEVSIVIYSLPQIAYVGAFS